MNLGINVPDPVKWEKKTYLVTCDGNCESITALIEFSGDDTADADIFANEGCPPQFFNGNSCPTCSMCERNSAEDNVEVCCNMDTQNGNR